MTAIAGMLALLAALAPAASAGGGLHEEEREANIDVEEVNRLVAAGAIRPLAEVIAVAAKRTRGDLVDVEVRRRDGRYVYEIEFLRGDRREEIYVDAATLALIAEN